MILGCGCTNLVGNLRPVLIQCLVAHPLCQWDARNPPGLCAGNLVDPFGQEVLGDLRGLPTSCVPRYDDHLMHLHSLNNVGAILEDREVLLITMNFDQLVKLRRWCSSLTQKFYYIIKRCRYCSTLFSDKSRWNLMVTQLYLYMCNKRAATACCHDNVHTFCFWMKLM